MPLLRLLPGSHRATSAARPSRGLSLALLSLTFAVGSLIVPATAAAASPRLLLTPAEGVSGMTVVVRGYNLPPRSRVQILWNGQYRGYPSAWVHRYGRFRVSITVPRGSAYVHKVSVASVRSWQRTVVTSLSQLGAVRATTGFRMLRSTPTLSPAPTPTPTPTPTPPPATTTGARPFPAPVTSRTVAVPASIDASGATNVSGALGTWLSSVPDGSVIAFPAGARYRVDTGIRFSSRHHLVFEGNGTTLDGSRGTSANTGSMFQLWNGNTNIAIRNFTLIGSNTAPGFHPTQESQMGVLIYQARNVELDRLTIRNVWGDGVYVGGNALFVGSDHVWLHDSSVNLAARCGVAIVQGQHVTVETSTFTNSGMLAFDIEADYSGHVNAHIAIRNNAVNYTGIIANWHMVLQADGVAGSIVHDVLFDRNRISGKPVELWVKVPRRQNITVTNNTSNRAAAGPVMIFDNVDGLTVTGNVQPMTSGQVAQITNSTQVNYQP